MLALLADDLWVASHTTRMAGVRFHGRMTVLRVDDGSLVLYSPVPLNDALGDAIDALGNVAHIVAPNVYHYLYAADAKARYPGATLWASPCLRHKRGDAIPFDEVLSAETAPLSPSLDHAVISAGPKADEIVLLHRPSRTLVVTDLVMNYDTLDHWWSRWFLRAAGAYPGLRQSKLWRSITKDRDGAAAGVETILGWSFDRVVPAHGEVVDGPDAAERFAAALWWMRRQPKPAA